MEGGKKDSILKSVIGYTIWHRNLRRALDLATLVASESYKNYAEFLPSELDAPGPDGVQKTHQSKMKDYLRALRVVHLLILKTSGVHPLRPASK